MSFIEAKEDGVRYAKNGRMTSYYPLCSICGKEVHSLSYIRGLRYTCKECKTEQYLSDKERSAEISKAEKEKKFENAVKRMQKMGCHGKPYWKAAQTVRSNLGRDQWFESTEEIMVAIELVRSKVKTRHQVKFGRYRADFVLPEEKVVLEVDGRIFHAGKAEKERLRDELIVLALGPGWEVIRIGDDLINQRINRLLPAIKKVKERRMLYRKLNNGALPEWYSDKAV